MHALKIHRLVGLVLVATAVVGLGYLRFGVTPGLPVVPAGARAGDLRLSPCTYTTESGEYAAECGTLIVPEDRANAASRLIALPLVRIKATASDSAEPIFYLEGGPGLSNMGFPQASRFAADRDLVLVGYRGRDGSVQLDCPEVPAALKRAPDSLSEAAFRDYADAFRACADRLTSDGLDLRMYSLPQQVDDLETARIALGYSRIDLLSQSAGTRTAMIYAWRYPTSINRSVMIGVNPPGNFLFEAQANNEQMARFAADCAQDTSCRIRTDDLAASMRRTATNIPQRWLFLPIKKSNVEVATFFNLIAPNDIMASTLDAWLSADEGDPSGFWALSMFGDLFTSPFVWGQYAAGAMIDAQAARDYFSAGVEDRTNLGWLGSAYSWGGGRLVDSWPTPQQADAYSGVRTSSIETLLIGGALDTATPPQLATQQLLPHLPKGHQVVLPGVGHIASFFETQPDAGAQLINTFFASGRIDDSLYQPSTLNFTPATTLSVTARMFAGVMLGLALLSLVSLIWMARVGGFGPKTSVLLRSLYAVVVGVGGWFLFGLIVTSAAPASHIDDPLLVLVSVGGTVGLCIHLASRGRDSASSTRTTSLAAGLAGALVGAWLGVNASQGVPAPMSGLLAPFTAVIGAVAGANLMVLILTMWWERPKDLTTTDAKPAREPVATLS